MSEPLSKSELEALFTICLMAAFADGDKNEAERASIKRVTERFGDLDPTLYQKVLMRQVSLRQATSALGAHEQRLLAYEMAVVVCEADGLRNQRENDFLSELRRSLDLDEASTGPILSQADELASASPQVEPVGLPPVIHQPGKPANTNMDGMILNYAILNGALELLPESLSTMAIIPLQMKMVYRVGKAHGFDLDRRHIGELLAAAGVGATSQMVEGFAQKLLRGVLGKMGGGMGRAVGGQLASSAMSFASTYALGHMAKKYYEGGRHLSGSQMREMFASLSEQAKGMYDRHAPQIQERARGLNPAQILSMVRGQ